MMIGGNITQFLFPVAKHYSIDRLGWYMYITYWWVLCLQIAGLQRELEQNDGMDEKIRIEISSYKSRISELQAQIAKLTNQVYLIALPT